MSRLARDDKLGGHGAVFADIAVVSGVDFGAIAGGRLAAITGFFDPAPAA